MRKRLVEKAKQEQRQKIVQAEGEAEAARMISFPRSAPSAALAHTAPHRPPCRLADET